MGDTIYMFLPVTIWLICAAQALAQDTIADLRPQIDRVATCMKAGQKIDFSAELDPGNLPPCVEECPGSLVDFNSQCVRAEEYENPLWFSFTLGHECYMNTYDQVCAWAFSQDVAAQSVDVVRWRVAQYFQIPVEEITGLLMGFQGDGTMIETFYIRPPTFVSDGRRASSTEEDAYLHGEPAFGLVNASRSSRIGYESSFVDSSGADRSGRRMTDAATRKIATSFFIQSKRLQKLSPTVWQTMQGDQSFKLGQTVGIDIDVVTAAAHSNVASDLVLGVEEDSQTVGSDVTTTRVDASGLKAYHKFRNTDEATFPAGAQVIFVDISGGELDLGLCSHACGRVTEKPLNNQQCFTDCECDGTRTCSTTWNVCEPAQTNLAQLTCPEDGLASVEIDFGSTGQEPPDEIDENHVDWDTLLDQDTVQIEDETFNSLKVPEWLPASKVWKPANPFWLKKKNIHKRKIK